MYILIVEDNKLQFETIKYSLLEDQIVVCDRIERIATELEFREKFEVIACDPPDVIILDLMIPWTSKNRWVEPPPEIAEAGFYLAGARCEKMMASDDRTQNVPIIIHSIIDEEEIQNFISPRPQINYWEKDFRSGLGDLIKRIVS